MPSTHNETFARVLIDRALTDSNWDLLDSKQVEFEFHTASGRADYLLKDKLGIRELETRQAASRRRLDELFQSLLYRAFAGEL